LTRNVQETRKRSNKCLQVSTPSPQVELERVSSNIYLKLFDVPVTCEILETAGMNVITSTWVQTGQRINSWVL